MVDPVTLPRFDDDDLAERVEALSAAEIDELPFGTIHLDPAGHVLLFSHRERELSGYHRPVPPDASFFSDIAPCLNTPSFRGRLLSAMAAGEFDLEILHVGDFSDERRVLRVRALPAASGGLWLFLRRE